jgi:hypothetical protein
MLLFSEKTLRDKALSYLALSPSVDTVLRVFNDAIIYTSIKTDTLFETTHYARSINKLYLYIAFFFRLPRPLYPLTHFVLRYSFTK